MKKFILGVTLILMLVLSLCFLSWSGLIRIPPGRSFSPNFPHLKSLTLNREGNRRLKAQNYQAAFDSYIKTLEFDPFSAETHLDLGLTYEGQQQMDKVLPSYLNAEKYAKSNEMKFMAYFNQAQLLGKEKKIDEALELYQKALTLVPTSKETKHNIELLIQLQQDQKGGGDNKEQNDQQDKQDQKDQKENKDQKNQKDQKDQKDSKDPKDQKDQKDQQQDPKDGKDKKKEEPKEYKNNSKPQPRPFKGKELSEGDVKKILGEIKQQEQRIRSEYNRKEVKEQARDKDW